MAGITDTAKLTLRNARELRAIPGIGPKTIDHLEECLHKVRLKLADDPFSGLLTFPWVA